MRYLTIQLRPYVKNPFPKLYVCRKDDESTKEALLKGLPSCFILSQGSFKIMDWYKTVSGCVLDQRSTYTSEGMKERETDGLEAKTLDTELKSAFVGIKDPPEELYFVVPVFQPHIKWKDGDLEKQVKNALKEGVTGGVHAPAFVSKNHKKKMPFMASSAGPPMKMPNGEVLSSCCIGCRHNTTNLMGMCEFGTPECQKMCAFPGKSEFLSNLRTYVKGYVDLMREEGQ